MIDLTQPRESILEQLLSAYSVWYDVQLLTDENAALKATASFHEHGTTYVVSRKAQIWAADRHEYVYFYSLPEVDRKQAETCLEQTFELGNAVVVPCKDHMCSYLVAVILCDKLNAQAADFLVNYRCRKNFKMSLYGWLEVHVIAIERESDRFLSNADGKKTAASLKSLFTPASAKNCSRWRAIIKLLMQRKCF